LDSSAGLSDKLITSVWHFDADRWEESIPLPYYSKYNPIERCWGILKQYWNGAKLMTAKTRLEWAKIMTWKGISPVIKLVETAYQKDVRMTKKAFNAFANRIDRDASLPKYNLTIRPQV
jgi:hypothetical protein